MLCDANYVDERSIQIKFNKLCRQFGKNPKYMSLGNDLIPDDEDISYEISVSSHLLSTASRIIRHNVVTGKTVAYNVGEVYG